MDNLTLIEGVLLTSLKIINNPKGNIFHVIKKNDFGFNGFGEVYISSINFNQIKGWKKHNEMICNFVVPYGKVKFVVLDQRLNSKTFDIINTFELSPDNYFRLTLPSGVWFSFQGLNEDFNQIINFSNVIHSPDENESIDLIEFNTKFNWEL